MEGAIARGAQALAAGRTEEAESAFAAAAAQGDWVGAFNLGVVRLGQVRFQDAVEPLQDAARARPDHPKVLSALGWALHRSQRHVEAETYLRAALRHDPHAHIVRERLATTLMAQGRYREAWPFWESRHHRVNCAPPEKLRYPEWRGESLEGKSILVWGEQGLGDEIQAARFLPRLRELGARRITLACLDLNRRLLSPLADHVVAREQPTVFVEPHDYWVLMWSIPTALNLDWSEIPAATPLGVRSPQPGGVAIVSRGNAANFNDVHRSIPSNLLASAAPGALELQASGDMADSLNVVAGLSLLISVDTSWVHLAGSVGTPCWVLLSHGGVDWRWFPKAETSPWYDSVRLFWQPQPGDWPSVIGDVTAALRQ